MKTTLITPPRKGLFNLNIQLFQNGKYVTSIFLMILSFIQPAKAQIPCDEPLDVQSQTSLCSNPTRHVITNFNPAYSSFYSWTFNPTPVNVSYSGGGAVAVVEWPNLTTPATIVITYNDGNCLLTDTVYVQPCCDRQYDILLEDVVLNQNTFYTNVTGTILIRGSIYIDNNYVLIFENCPNILVGPGARIIIKTGEVAYINSHIRNGCGVMWQGHILKGAPNNGISGIKFIDGSIAEDAMFMVDARENAAVKVEQVGSQPRNRFLNNYTTFYVPPAPSALPINAVDFNPFEGFEIDGSGGLSLATYHGQPPIGPVPYAGIWLNDQFYLETDNSNLNTKMTFNNLNAGIVARRANLYIKRCEFTNITGHNYYSGVYNGTTFGTGISCVNGWGGFSVTQIGFGSASNSLTSFHTVRTGIYTEHTRTDISSNKMELMSTGIHVTRNSFSFTTSIANNYIHCQWPDGRIYGIRALFNDQTNNLDISQNEIDLYADPVEGPNIGIELEEFNQMPNTTTVKSNKIHMRGNTYGIHARNTNVTLISNNESIIYDFNSAKRGINLINCIRQRIIENYCHGLTNNYANAGTVFSYGIYTNNSPRGTYVCNTTEILRRGIYFQNNCDQTDFRTNIMGRSSRGLLLSSNAIIGLQPDKGNKWPAGPSGYFNGNGAANNNILNTGASAFYTPASYVFTPNPIPGFGWFNNNTAIPPECLPNDPLPDLSGDEPTPGDSLIVEDELEYEYEAEEWQNKMTVYEKGLDEPAFMNSAFLIEQFFMENENTSIGLNAAFKKQLHELSSYCTAEMDALSILIGQLAAEMKQLIFHDSLLYAGGLTSTQMEQLKTEKDSIIDLIKLMTIDFNDIETLFRACLNNSINGMQTAALGLPDNMVYESNLKQAAEIYLTYLLTGLIPYPSIQSLYSIALQCNSEGGPGVELARGLIKVFNNQFDFDDEQLCVASSRWISNDEIEEIERSDLSSPYSLTVVDDLLTVISSDEHSVMESVFITDVSGRTLDIKTSAGAGYPVFNISGLAKGYYVVTIKGKEQFLHTLKFIR